MVASSRTKMESLEVDTKSANRTLGLFSSTFIYFLTYNLTHDRKNLSGNNRENRTLT